MKLSSTNRAGASASQLRTAPVPAQDWRNVAGAGVTPTVDLRRREIPSSSKRVPSSGDPWGIDARHRLWHILVSRFQSNASGRVITACFPRYERVPLRSAASTASDFLPTRTRAGHRHASPERKSCHGPEMSGHPTSPSPRLRAGLGRSRAGDRLTVLIKP